MKMSRWNLPCVAAVIVASACTGGGDDRQDTAKAVIRADTAPAGAAKAPVADSAGGMAGMDHSKMPGMTGAPAAGRVNMAPARSGQNMVGMDHSRMNMGTSTPQQTVPTTDHAGHAAAPPVASTTPAVTTASAADQKLQKLIARLVEDLIVQQRIQADSVLRSRWQDSTVRRRFIQP